MDKSNKDKDCFADRPDPRTEDLWKPDDVPTSTQLQDQSMLMQNWTRNDERLAVDLPWLKIAGSAGAASGEDVNVTMDRIGAPAVVADEQRVLQTGATEFDLEVKKRSTEVPPDLEPSLDVDGRKGDRTIRPGDAMPRRIDYEALAKQITDFGRIPESIENALKNGVGHPGLDLDELNKILGPKGFYIDRTAMKTGLMATLYKNGEVADCVVAKTPAAQQVATEMLRTDRAKVSKGCSALAEEMIDDGVSPQSIRKALENGVGVNGLDLEELNSILGPKGFYFELSPSETGLRANLHQNGNVIDFVNVRTPEARKIAEQILPEEKVDCHTASTLKPGDQGDAVQLPPAVWITPPVVGSFPSPEICPVRTEQLFPGGGKVPMLDRSSIVKALEAGAELVNSALYRESKLVKALACRAIDVLDAFN